MSQRAVFADRLRPLYGQRIGRQTGKLCQTLQWDLDQPDLAASLIGDIQEFRSAADTNHSLGELYELQAHNKITPRRAAVMAYTCNLLLRTLPAIARDNGLQFQQKGPQQEDIMLDFRDWPDPEDGSGIKGPAVYRRAVLARREMEKTQS